MSKGGPPIICRALALPKRGHSSAEYEDAAAANEDRGRFAIADGAAETSFAALWARLLVAEFVNAPAGDLAPWLTWLPPLQQRWAAAVGTAAMPWYAEIKLQQGAFATFLGVAAYELRWQAVAVGDSCLFQTRGSRLHYAFPLVSSGEFGTNPWLVGSRGCDGEAVEKRTRRVEADWLPGDCLWLMTDALAKWFLEQVEGSGQPWQELDRLLHAPAPQPAFEQWVTTLRDAGRLRNDDVTLMLIERGR
jgi:hypothetical protein